MRRLLRAYANCSKSERSGCLLILSALLLFRIITLLLPHTLQPPDDREEVRLNRELAALVAASAGDSSDSGSGTAAAELFPFDPNTLDSNGFRALGLSARTTRLLLNWRRKGKRFYDAAALSKLYTLSDAEYQRLAPYIRIQETAPAYSDQAFPAPRYQNDYPPLPEHIDLNTADSFTLVRLKGIGPYVAHRLISYRGQLGGFLALEQLREVFRFPDSTFEYLSSRLQIRATQVRKLSLNTATEAELALHPYIGEQMAHNIILMRQGLGKFEKTSQLRLVPLMNDEKYRKIAAYCIID